jgi:hypothetical protein
VSPAAITGWSQATARTADASGLKFGPQTRVSAVDLVAGHPSGRHASVQRASDHDLGQGRLGRKPDLIGNAGRLQARRTTDPSLRQVQLPVDQGVPNLAGIHQVDRDLGVLDPACGAGVLALHPHRLGALLQVAGLVHDQHRLRIAERLGEIGIYVSV